MHHLAHEFHAAVRWAELTAKVPQQCGLAAPADAENGEDPAAGNGQVDALQHFAFAISKMKIADFDQVFQWLTQCFLLFCAACHPPNAPAPSDTPPCRLRRCAASRIPCPCNFCAMYSTSSGRDRTRLHAEWQHTDFSPSCRGMQSRWRCHP